MAAVSRLELQVLHMIRLNNGAPNEKNARGRSPSVGKERATLNNNRGQAAGEVRGETAVPEVSGDITAKTKGAGQA